jgi:hypothetical protein
MSKIGKFSVGEKTRGAVNITGKTDMKHNLQAVERSTNVTTCVCSDVIVTDEGQSRVAETG